MLATILATFSAIVLDLLVSTDNRNSYSYSSILFFLIIAVTCLSYVGVIPSLAFRWDFLTQIEWLQFEGLDLRGTIQIVCLMILCLVACLVDGFLPRKREDKLPHSFFYLCLTLVGLLAVYQRELLVFVCLFELSFIIEAFAIRDRSMKFIIKKQQILYGCSLALVSLMFFLASEVNYYQTRALGMIWATWFLINAFLKNAVLIEKKSTHRPGLKFAIDIIRYYMLSIFVYRAFNESQILREHELILMVCLILLCCFLSLFARNRKIGRDQEVCLLQNLALGIFVVTVLVSLFGDENISKMGAIFILYSGIGSMISMYSHKMNQYYGKIDEKVESFIFLLPLLFILGLPFTYSRYYYSEVWMVLYSYSWSLLLACLFVFFIIYFRFIPKFKDLLTADLIGVGSMNISHSKAFIWLSCVFLFSLLSVILINVYQ